jgi:quercetin dioxygenase-like cupin family protein
MEKLPFKERSLSSNQYIRSFSKDLDYDEMKWHWDEEDREFEILEGVGWSFQRDNSLPMEMKVGDKIKVKKGEWHRALKKPDLETDLVILLTKSD